MLIHKHHRLLVKPFIFFLLLGISVNLIGQISPRSEVSLHGTWLFVTDVNRSGLSEGWNTQLPPNAHDVKVPHTWNVEKGTEDYTGLAWYEKQFSAPAEWKGKNIRVKFAAIYHDAVIYLNGEKLKEHVGSGYTSFYVDISNKVKLGSSNKLIISADNAFSNKGLPFEKSFDWSNDGGIIRDVNIQVSDKPSIRYVHVTPKVNFTDTIGNVKLSIRLWEEDVKNVVFTISINEKRSQNTVFSKDLTLDKQGDEFATVIELKKVNLWRFDHPNLYQITVIARNKQIETDKQQSQFGFRTIELNGSKLLVNKEIVRLPGIEYMPGSNPDYGSAEPAWFMDTVVSALKDMNITISRFHWQVDEHMLDLMDEKGILLQAEIPWWQRPGKLTPELMENAQMQFTEMIERDYNHPCIFAWGISNEVSGTNKNQYVSLKQFVKQIDSTRLITVVSNQPFKRKLNDESLIGDLPTWNEYIGTWFGKDRTELPEYFSTIESFIGNRPLFITEAGLCEPRFVGGDLRRVDDMIYHYKEWAKRDYIIGCIYFCLNDYRTQMGEDGAGRFKARIHGLTDLYLNRKPSFYVYKKLASPIEILNVTKKSDTKISIVLFNKNTLPSYSLLSYKVRYKTLSGDFSQKVLPFMKPGDTVTIELENIAPRFAFDILSPNGSHVTGYPLGNSAIK